MPLLNGKIGERILDHLLIHPSETDSTLASYSSPFSEIVDHFELSKTDLRDSTVVDFGCGYGRAAIEAALHGVGTVIGVDIRNEVLEYARAQASKARLANCLFANCLSRESYKFRGIADIIVSIDAFEHYADPERTLCEMARYLKPDGTVYISFGPPWWHPYGAHLNFMTKLPWPHVVFSEELLIKARSKYKKDGAQRFEEVEGGLNRMSIRKFERILERSSFFIKSLRLIPIRGSSVLHGCLPGGRELFTSVVKAALQKRPSAHVQL
jgi:SAM-dependent methyltransferase